MEKPFLFFFFLLIAGRYNVIIRSSNIRLTRGCPADSSPPVEPNAKHYAQRSWRSCAPLIVCVTRNNNNDNRGGRADVTADDRAMEEKKNKRIKYTRRAKYSTRGPPRPLFTAQASWRPGVVEPL